MYKARRRPLSNPRGQAALLWWCGMPGRSHARRRMTGALCVLAAAGSAVAQVHAQGDKYAAAEARQAAMVDQADAGGPFHANWESLGAYKIPDWFRDAKFGIFLHWGVYSVPGFRNEWYPRNMYVQGSP